MQSVFDMMTGIYEAKTLIEHISCDCKSKFGSMTFNSNKKWSNVTCQCECENYLHA